MARAKGFGADSPDSRDPRQAGAGVPLVGEVEPLARADRPLNLIAGFERKQSGVADKESSIGLLEHGDGIGRVLEEGGLGTQKLAKEDFGVSERTARCGICSDGADSFEGMACSDDELDGADTVERGDGTAGDNRQLRGKRGDGDEPKVGASTEEFIGAKRRFRVVEGIALGKLPRQRRVFEIPHQRRWVQEIDGGNADGMGWIRQLRISLIDIDGEGFDAACRGWFLPG